jgi:hypothetical protein
MSRQVDLIERRDERSNRKDVSGLKQINDWSWRRVWHATSELVKQTLLIQQGKTRWKGQFGSPYSAWSTLSDAFEGWLLQGLRISVDVLTASTEKGSFRFIQ